MAAFAALPLVFASGAGSAGTRSFGVVLFGGYLAYALLGGFWPPARTSTPRD